MRNTIVFGCILSLYSDWCLGIRTGVLLCKYSSPTEAGLQSYRRRTAVLPKAHCCTDEWAPMYWRIGTYVLTNRHRCIDKWALRYCFGRKRALSLGLVFQRFSDTQNNGCWRRKQKRKVGQRCFVGVRTQKKWKPRGLHFLFHLFT